MMKVTQMTQHLCICGSRSLNFWRRDQTVSNNGGPMWSPWFLETRQTAKLDQLDHTEILEGHTLDPGVLSGKAQAVSSGGNFGMVAQLVFFATLLPGGFYRAANTTWDLPSWVVISLKHSMSLSMYYNYLQFTTWLQTYTIYIYIYIYIYLSYTYFRFSYIYIYILLY